MDILLREKNLKEFDQLSKKYLDTNPSSARYTQLFFDYSRAYIRKLTEELSFILIRDKQPLALVFLPIEISDGKKSVSVNEGYVTAPLCTNEKVEKEVFGQIDLLAKKHSISKIKFFTDPLVETKLFNILRKYQYLDTSSSDCFLDLTKPTEYLWNNIRKGHRSDIKKILNNDDFKINTIDYRNPNSKTHYTYVKLHHKCAGKITRNKKTFDLQFQMIKENQAVMFELKYQNKPISYCYFFHDKKGVLYASAADDPDFKGFPVYHSLIWKAIEYYHKNNFEKLVFCEPCGYGIQLDNYLDKKQEAISSFKRGFGGKTISLFKGIKYFSREIFEKDINKFSSRYLDVINEK